MLSQLYKKNLSPEDTNKILIKFGFTEDDVTTLNKLFPNKLQRVLINLALHHNDFKIQLLISPSKANSDPIESWVENVWNKLAAALQIEEGMTCDDIPDDQLIVDIVEGTKRGILGLVSPYKFMIRETIERFAKSSKIVLKTKFDNEDDKFLAYANYYSILHPEKLKNALDAEIASGIICVEENGITGISLQFIDVNKLNPKFIDGQIKINKSSVRHIIVHIGYTFGEQTSNVIKGLIALFGKKIRSFNVIGKAGGFVGERCDVLVADRIIHYEKGDVISNNTDFIDTALLAKMTNHNVFKGPLLTVAGTILQNRSLLNYYKKFRSCIGVEMEGYYFIQEIEKYKAHGILSQALKSTYLYHISDLPLQSGQNLAKESELYNRDEGVPVVNAFYRFVLNNILK